MFETPVYDRNGVQLYKLSFNDEIVSIDNRVIKGNKCFYKGAGIHYNGHWLHPEREDFSEYDIQYRSSIFYIGYRALKKCFVDKFGIFQEQYAPQATDFIGSCSNRELSIIENTLEFELSSCKILDIVNHDKDNHQYYLMLDYDCNRIKYLTNRSGDPIRLHNLIDYMVQNNWNFAWDKKSIDDISYHGKITDPADIFQSRSIDHLLGTVYSIIYSLGMRDSNKYLEFIQASNLHHTDNIDFVFNAVEILRRNGIDVSILLPYSNKIENYKHIVINHLVVGKNCAHCDIVDYGDRVMETYLHNAKVQMGLEV